MNTLLGRAIFLGLIAAFFVVCCGGGGDGGGGVDVGGGGTPPPTGPPNPVATYYIDTNNASASDSNPGTEALPWKTITKANQTLVAGDTVYIKTGTYTTYIAPANSGKADNRITYRNYGTDIVTISGTAYVIRLNGNDYITVTGINGTNFTYGIYLYNGATNNVISYGTFGPANSTAWDVSIIYQSSQYNWIHHITMYQGGECSEAGSDRGYVLAVGAEEDGADFTQYNLIEDSTFYWGGHHVVALLGRYNTFRNNYVHNEAWSRSRGNRNMSTVGVATATGYNLIEGNRFGYAARPCDDYTVGNVPICSNYNILRYNSLYHHNAYGVAFYDYGTGYSGGSYNKFYNNTIFNSGYNIYPTYEGGSEDTAIEFSSSTAINNVLKNNLYYSNYQVYTGYTANQTFANEFNGDVSGDPKFVNASTTPPADKTDSTLPNLNLQSSSPAINAGGALTTVAVSDTGSGTSLVVSDARYFQDGTYAPSGTAYADWIAVGTVGNTVQISSINYSTNTITLSNSISRNDGDSVWLYKKSDGVRVLYGSAPDCGSYEYAP